MTEYGAYVVTIHTAPHPNADRLALGTVAGYQVVVGKDTPNGSLGLFFTSDLQLSEEYATANDLVRRKDADGNAAGGFFDPNRKVRAQRFRGERSDGYFASLDSLSFIEGFNPTTLTPGTLITEINGVPICKKYVNPHTARRLANQQSRKQPKGHPWFLEHVDTQQFGYNYDKIPSGSLVSLTLKVHGTSQRSAAFIETPKPTFFQRLFRRTPAPQRREMIGTRRVVLQDTISDNDFYGDDAFRRTAHDSFASRLHIGETVYYELVGYVSGERTIMPAHNFSGTNDPQLKRWGSNVTYTYGALPGQTKLFVYRITRTIPDVETGLPVVTELSYPQMFHRATELGLTPVPALADPIVVTEGNRQSLHDTVLALSDGSDPLDASHPREGVVVRVDTPTGGTYFLKSKGFTFKIGEGIAEETATEANLEDIS